MLNEVAQTSPAPSPDQPVPDEFDLVCEHCGYSLVGLISNRCPECGEAFDPLQLPLARVPWLFRRRLGKWHAYRDTVIQVVWRPSEFGRELTRPVKICVEDAREFRRTSIRIAAASCAVVALTFVLFNFPWSSARADLQRLSWAQFSEFLGFCCMIPWGIFVSYWFFYLITDLPTFIWKGMSNNPIQLAPVHYYASAPLGLLPLASVPLMAWYLGIDNFIFADALWTFSIAAILHLGLLVAIILLWLVPLRLMRVASGCSWVRVLGLALYLPVHWLLMGGMFAGVFAVGTGIIVFVLRNTVGRL